MLLLYLSMGGQVFAVKSWSSGMSVIALPIIGDERLVFDSRFCRGLSAMWRHHHGDQEPQAMVRRAIGSSSPNHSFSVFFYQSAHIVVKGDDNHFQPWLIAPGVRLRRHSFDRQLAAPNARMSQKLTLPMDREAGPAPSSQAA